MIRKLRALAVVVGLALASPASAVDIYVAPFQIGNGSGSSAFNAKSLGSFNAQAQPGWTALMLDGTYPDEIRPARSGTAEARITYQGNQANRENVTVPHIYVLHPNNDFVTVKWVRSLDEVKFAGEFRDQSWSVVELANMAHYAVGDSLYGIRIEQDLNFCATKDFAILGNSFGDSSTSALIFSNREETGDAFSEGLIFADNTCNVGMGYNGSYSPFHWDGIRSGQILRNRVNSMITNQGDGSWASSMYLLSVQNTHFADNRWFVSNKGGRTLFHPYMRDDTYFNVFDRDSFIVDSTSTFEVGSHYSAQGTTHNTHSNTYNDCYWSFINNPPFEAQYGVNGTIIDGGSMLCKDCGDKGAFAPNTGSGDSIYWGRGSAIRNTVIQNKTGPAIVIRFIAGGPLTNYIEGNTFFGLPRSSAPAVAILDAGAAGKWKSPVSMKDNIYYSSTVKDTVYAGVMFRFPTASDINLLTSNYNLGANWFGGAAGSGDGPDLAIPGGHAIAWGIGQGGALNYSRPGTGGPWWNASGEDANSVATGNGAAQTYLKGPMGFTNQTASDSMAYRFHVIRANATPKTPSAALGTGTSGRDIGAIQSTADNTRPAPINNVIIGHNSPAGATIQWTAVGDDSLTGTAHHYDIRGKSARTYAELQNLFTAVPEDSVWPTLWRIAGPAPADPAGSKLNWVGGPEAQSVAIPTGPTPGAPGTLESFGFTSWVTPSGQLGRLRDLSGDYFGIWVAAVDEAGRHSAVAGQLTIFGRQEIIAAEPRRPSP